MRRVMSVSVLVGDANELAKSGLRICPLHVIDFTVPGHISLPELFLVVSSLQACTR